MLKNIIESYIVRPWKILFKNPSIIFFVFILVLFNGVSGEISKIFIQLNLRLEPNYFFHELPKIAFNLIAENLIYCLMIFPVFFFGAALVSVIAMANISEVYQENYTSLKSFLKKGWTRNFLWFIPVKMSIYAFLIIASIIIYLILRHLYLSFGLNTIYLFLLYLAALYPLFYLLVSFSAMMSVLRMSSNERLKKFSYLTKKRNAITIYLFYATRLAIEIVLVGVVPVLITKFGLPIYLMTLSIAIGLTIPLAFFRSSGFEVKLFILRNDVQIKSLFSKYYDKYHVNEQI